MLPELGALLEAAAEAGARRALAAMAASEASALVPIKSAKIAYRAILVAAKAGELRIHRKGKAAFVESAELDAWIMRAPKAPEPEQPKDEIGELVEINERRRRKGRAA